jgi:hypothetical protein
MEISSIFPDFYFAYSWCILIAMLVLPFHKDKKQVLQFVVWCNLWLALLSLMNGFAWYETMTSNLRNILFRQSVNDWAAINHFLTFDNALIIAPMQLFWIRFIRESFVASCLVAVHLQMYLFLAIVKNTSIDYSGIVWTIFYEQTNIVTPSNLDFIPSGWSSHYYINIVSTALGVGIFTLLLFLTHKFYKSFLPIK